MLLAYDIACNAMQHDDERAYERVAAVMRCNQHHTAVAPPMALAIVSVVAMVYAVVHPRMRIRRTPGRRRHSLL